MLIKAGHAGECLLSQLLWGAEAGGASELVNSKLMWAT